MVDETKQDEDKPEVYEIVNPSDLYTFRASSDKVALAVVLLTGEGKYSGKRMRDGEDIGGMIAFLSTPDAEKKFAADFVDFGVWLRANRVDVIAALDSVLCMGASDRFLYETAIESKQTEAERIIFRDKVHDERRSSMNNIGAYAWKLADHFRSDCPVVTGKKTIAKREKLVIDAATSKRVGLKAPEGGVPFPTMAEVDRAVEGKDGELLFTWFRFLPSAITEDDRAVQDKIYAVVTEAKRRAEG